jgi:DNA-binding SARP family transcriptional activator
MTLDKSLSSDWLTDDPIGWPTAIELIKTKQFEDVAESLYNFQRTSEQAGETLQAELLAAARLICLACSQCQADVIWHQRAGEESTQREHELEQALVAIFELLSNPDFWADCQDEHHALVTQTIELASVASDESVKPFGLLQHLHKLFKGRAKAKPAGQIRHLNRAPATASRRPIETERSITVIANHDEAAEARSQAGEPYRRNPLSLDIYCLGPFRVYRNDQVVENWSSRKGLAVFKYLVTHGHSPVAKDVLMDIFWPEADPEAARRNLHQAIYALRQTLKLDDQEIQYIQFENDCYHLNHQVEFWVDYKAFEEHVEAGQTFERKGLLEEAMAQYGIAEGLYQGDFMAEDLYDEWPQLPRENLRQSYFCIVFRLAEYYLARQEYAATIALSQRVLTMDNCQEQAYQNLMRCYVAQGQRHLAIRQYQFYVQTLKTELDLDPSPQIQALYQQIAGN